MARSRQAITFEVRVLRRGKWQIHARYPEAKKALAVQDGKSLENLSTIRAVKVVRKDYGRSTESTVYESPSAKDQQAAEGKSGPARQGKAGARAPIAAAAPVKSSSNVRVFSKLLLVVTFSIGIAALLTFLASVWLSDSDIGATAQGRLLFGVLVGTFLISAISLAKSLLSADELSAWVQGQGHSRTPRDVPPAAPKGPPVASPSPTGDEEENEAARLADAAAAMLAETLHGEAPEAAEQPDEAAEGSETPSSYTEEQKVFMKKFLSDALVQAQARRDKMDTYDKFGIDLFLAGACEALSQERDLDGRVASEVLSDSVQFMGFEKAQAETFSGRYRDYLLADPRYMQMFVAGRDALRSYFSGDNGGTNHLEQALEEWNRPKARKETTEMTTVMFTDMVGSTSLTLTRGDVVAQQAVRAHNLIVREALGEFGGREIKHTGDGIMAAFPTTSNSVEAAIAIQAKVRARNRSIPEPPLHLKIGINAGEPIVEDDDLFGATVQLAARVVDAAQSGQILVSEIVRGICAGKDLRFVNRGPFQLDGFKDHVILHEAVWDENAPIEDAPATEPPRPEDTRAEEGTGEPDAGKTAEQPVAAEPARAPGGQASPPAAGRAHTAQADKEAGA
ncbi:MAG: adenylate/guanylate cyclase domain-containing protein [Proteobacteria bacterium]|nr:adenylate/guanylate cyclase domain-containing protein [Pseudomonadota bacterium]